MTDKVVFFILGALLATLAYFAGDMHLSAENELEVIPKLLVKKLIAESIEVGFSDTYRIRMIANHKSASVNLLSDNKKKHIALIITKEAGEDGAFIAIRDDTGRTRIMDVSSVNRFHQE